MTIKIYFCLLIVCSFVLASHSRVHIFDIKRKRRSLPKVGDPNEVPMFSSGDYFVTQVSVGTPAQTLNVAIDLEKSYFWLNTPACTTTYCNSRGNKFDSSASSSFTISSSSPFTISYLDGSSVVGTYGTDTLTIGTLTVEKQSIVTVDTETGFSDEAYDGLIGLAPTVDSLAVKLPTPLENLFSTSTDVNAKVHSLLLWADGEGGNLLLGGVRDYLYIPPIYLKQVVKKGLWRVSLPNFTLINDNLGTITSRKLHDGSIGAQFDSSITYIAAPSSALDRIKSFTGGTTNADGFIEIPSCNTANFTFTITFTMTNNVFTLPGNSFVEEDDTNCIMKIVEHGQPFWMMGLPFLKNYYSVYDAERALFGLALPRARPGKVPG